MSIKIKKPAKGTNTKTLRDVIVRTYSAGVFAGQLKEHDRKTGHATVINARRLWYWSGAASLSQLAIDGTSRPDQCKFPAPVAELIVAGVLEIIPLTEKARASIDGVQTWRA